MLPLFEPAEVEERVGKTPEELRELRRRGFLNGVGEQLPNGRWKYHATALLTLASGSALVDAGVPMGPAYALAKATSIIVYRYVLGDLIRLPAATRFAVGFLDQKAEDGLRVEFVKELTDVKTGGCWSYLVDAQALAAQIKPAVREVLRNQITDLRSTRPTAGGS